MSKQATGTNRGTPRKRVKIVQITVMNDDGTSAEVDAKECTKCGEVKVLADFAEGKRGLGGRCSRCRDCKRHYRETNAVSIREYNRRYCETNAESIREYFRAYRHRREAMKRVLLFDWTVEHLTIILTLTNGPCALSHSLEDNHVDHVIPLAWGYGGSYVGNMIPLSSALNLSKSDAHLYGWFETNRQRFELDRARFDAMTAIIAEQNGLTSEEYREYYDWCYDNQRSIDDIRSDNKRYGYVVSSLELWREATGIAFPIRLDLRCANEITRESTAC